MDTNKLPAQLKQILGSIELNKKVREVGAKYKLHIDDIGSLGTIIDDTIIGIVKLENFEETLKRNLDTDETTIKGLATEINTQIFQPVHDALMQIQEAEIKSGEPQNNEGEKQSEQPNPTKELEDLHAALNPESAPSVEIRNSGLPNQKIPAPTSPAAQPNPHEQKLTTPTQTAPKETIIDHRTQATLIPGDIKERINKDPYKENI